MTTPLIYIYVLRSTALVAREANVATLQRLCAASTLPIAVAIVTSQEPGEMSMDLIKAVVNIDATPDIPEAYRNLLKPMHVNQLSNNMKHFSALRMVVENAKLAPAATHVILEDDVLFNDDAITMLNSTVLAAPKGFDLLFLGLPSTKSGTPKEISFEKAVDVFKTLPCCDSYVVTPAAAATLIAAYLPVRLPTQLQLSYLFQKLDLKVFICSPNVFIDGSKLGVFMSAIEQNNQLIWNPQYNQIRSLLYAPSKHTAAERADVDTLLKSAHFKDHPDFRYLTATSHIIAKRYEEARVELDRAFDIYVAEKCVFGPECQFMKDYVQLFKFLQPPI